MSITSEAKAPESVITWQNHDQHLRIERSSGWRSLRLGELWEYRELLWFMVDRDLRARFRQMALGPLWIVLKPLLNMVVFTLVFGEFAQLPSDGVPYPLFSFAALLPWTYFVEASIASTTSLASRMNIISKIYFPRLVIPISSTLAGLADLGVTFLVLLGMMWFYGIALSLTILLVPLYVILTAVTGLTIGLWAATLAVRFRDLQWGMQYLIQFGVYLTPVAYSVSAIPEKYRFLLELNPMFWAVEGFRSAILGKGLVVKPGMFISIGITLLLFISGLFVFRRTERSIVDWL